MRAEQNRLSKDIGPQIGKLKRQLKNADAARRDALEADIRQLEERPVRLKAELQAFDGQLAEIEPEWKTLWLEVPQPPDADVPPGLSSEDNQELRRWNPPWFDTGSSFAENKGFAPRSHIELAETLGLVDFERAVRMVAMEACFLSSRPDYR